jgi:CDP-diacylglycerol--glycerol-3-phosphate 3-phosphatidyltransferase
MSLPGKFPIALTALRALLAPVVVLLALRHPDPRLFGACLVLALVSDIFDGVIARRLGVATPSLRRLDSIADSLFYLAVFCAAWIVYPAVIQAQMAGWLLLAALELARYAYDFAKFRREASYHMWSSKLWGLCLFAGFFALLALGRPGLPLTLAIWIGILADLEGLAISFVLREWRTDVPTLVHALRLR